MCESCGEPHDGSYGSGRFCNSTCRASFRGTRPLVKPVVKRQGKPADKTEVLQLEQTPPMQAPREPSLCECCGEPHDGSYGAGRFCNSTCRAKYARNPLSKLPLVLLQPPPAPILSSKQPQEPPPKVAEVSGARKSPPTVTCEDCGKECVAGAGYASHRKTHGAIKDKVRIPSFNFPAAATITPPCLFVKVMASVEEAASKGSTISEGTGALADCPDEPATAEGACSTSSRPAWFCQSCGGPHEANSAHALAPFRKRCGWQTNSAPKDGDCFYFCVVKAVRTAAAAIRAASLMPGSEVSGQGGSAALGACCPGRISPPPTPPLTVRILRDAVANAVTEDQLQFYRIFAEAK